MIAGPDGKPAQVSQENKAEPDMSKPLLSIDPAGNLTLFLPLSKTNEVYARGMIDVTRSHVLSWYVKAQQEQRETAILAAKTGFQRFKDKLLQK